jgi:3-oxoacyl-[acyl-carrier-protein] synthase II
MTRRRVVVTGIGMTTPFGLTKDDAWSAFLKGENGISKIEAFDTSDFGHHIGGEIKDFNATAYMDKRDVKRYDRFVHFAVSSSVEAVKDSGIDMEAVDKERFGCTVAAGIGGILSAEDLVMTYVKKGAKRVSPLTIPKIMVNCGCGQVAIELGLKGVNYAPVSACASGTHAIGLALRHIQWGEADLMLAGGAEAGISLLGLGGFGNMGALASRNDDPEHASRPFDETRDGFVIGEGGGTLLLEELEHAKARGATIYAEMGGYGFCDDGYHITAPDESGDGGNRCMSIAIKDSGATPDQVDYINAHGTSTPFNDKIETTAIKLALGEHAKNVKINSTKSMIGHTLGAAGGIEGGVMALSIYHQKIHGTRNYTTPDPNCDLDYTVNGAEDREIRYALSNSLGFGGHNATICMKKYEE